MNPLVVAAISMLLKLLAPFLKKLVDLAYREIEEWASGREKETGEKVKGEEKMKLAVDLVVAKRPDVSPEAVKAMLEMRHAGEKDRARRVGKARG